jgi:uncharacterized protein involved in exopolysaccharide biosynthesis
MVSLDHSEQASPFAGVDWKWLIGSATLGFCVAVAASYLMRPAYRAEVVLMAADSAGQESMLSDIANQAGGLAALAGLGGSATPQRIEFLETLRSSGLARKFVQEQGLVRVLCDARIAWCESGTEGSAESNDNAGLREFRRHILSVSEDKRTNVISVSITWFDRKQAAQWANEYVALANRELQRRAIAEAHQRIVFLEKAAGATDVEGTRSAIYRLMESQLKSEMFASTRPDYAFRVIDSAVPPDRKDKLRPLRAVIGLIGAVAALALMYAGTFAVGYSGRLRRAHHARLQTSP